MKAQRGKVYALVQGGRAHQIFTIDELPEWHDGLLVLEVTNLGVEVGDVYNEETNSFTKL